MCIYSGIVSLYNNAHGSQPLKGKSVHVVQENDNSLYWDPLHTKVHSVERM